MLSSGCVGLVESGIGTENTKAYHVSRAGRSPLPQVTMAIIVAALVGLLSQAPAALPPAAHPDFPRQDRQAWGLQRKGPPGQAGRGVEPTRSETADAGG